MPGTLLHLAFAQEVYQQSFSIRDLDFINKFYFMCGNLIPDETNDKHLSHYRLPYGVTGFFVPVLDKAKKDLLINNDSLKLGIYCHLYLDHYFIKDFIIPEFIWDYYEMTVTNPRNNKTWTTAEFFSRNGFYSAYSELNHLLIENNVIDLSMINKLPSILPQTKIAIFDTRREKTWKQELAEYLSQEIEYTGEILNYDRVIDFLKKTAKQFIEEIN